MTPYGFAKLRETSDKEALCLAVFDEAYDQWTTTGLGVLNESQLSVICVETFFSEILNGGLEQYLWNQSGRYAGFAPTALRRVGLPEYADFLQEAITRCQNLPQLNDFGVLEDFYEIPETGDTDDVDEEIDQRFFDLYFANKSEFRAKLFQFIVDHEDDFITG